MNYEDLTPEQLDKARACKSAEELVELANEEGVELTDEQVEFISGGGGDAWNESSDSFSGYPHASHSPSSPRAKTSPSPIESLAEVSSVIHIF